MKEYHKIQTVFKRDPETKMKTLLHGQFSLPEFEYLQDNKWVFTEKIDGTNIRIIIEDGKISFGGKTDNAQIPSKLVERLQEIFIPQKDKLLDKFPDGGCLYGEGYGNKIQKVGGLYRNDQDFILFDVKVGKWWLERESVESIAKEFGLDIVPILGEGSLNEMVDRAKDGFKSTIGTAPAEGFVARPKIDLNDRGGHRIITKIKCKDFLRG